MSLNVAIQSVVFYILSCSTCAKINHRRKAKVQAKKDRLEKEELEMQQPGLYRHPSPFSTNQYWTEDIMMGPGPGPGKKGDKKNESQNALSSVGPGSIYAGSTAQGTDAPSSPTAVTEASRLSGEGWNFKRYQREDEALWGIDFHVPGQKIKEAIAKAGNSASRFVESRLSRSGDAMIEENPGTYFAAKNPPVNDLHPPVVSTQPTSRDETRWMLQPPPSAKIMEGKERVIRSRADSNGSSHSRRIGEEPLSRQVTGKLVDARLQSGEIFPDRPISARKIKTPTSAWPRPQRRGTNRSHSPDSSSEEMRARTRRRPQPIVIATTNQDSDDSLDCPYLASGTSSAPPRTAQLTKRPSLRSKASSSYRIRKDTSDESITIQDNSQPSTLTPTSQTQLPLNRLSPNANSVPENQQKSARKSTEIGRENEPSTTTIATS